MTDFLRDERVLWAIFGLNAVSAVFWAMQDIHGLVVVLLGGFAGVALMNATFRPTMNRLDKQSDELLRQGKDLHQQLEREGIGVEIARIYYGGLGGEPSDDPSRLRVIADWLDQIDDAMDASMAKHDNPHRVERTVQADLRRIAERLEQ